VLAPPSDGGVFVVVPVVGVLSSLGVGDALSEALGLVDALGVGEVLTLCAFGCEVASGSTFDFGSGLITSAGSSGAAPPTPPWALSCCTMAGGVLVEPVTCPNCAPSHIAGPSPTAMMAPKSASGPRSISAPSPRIPTIIAAPADCPLPNFPDGEANNVWRYCYVLRPVGYVFVRHATVSLSKTVVGDVTCVSRSTDRTAT